MLRPLGMSCGSCNQHAWRFVSVSNVSIQSTSQISVFCVSVPSISQSCLTCPKGTAASGVTLKAMRPIGPMWILNVQVHVGWLEGGTAVFAFRGTASKQDGLQDVKIFSRNIDYLQELYPGVKAHLGQPLLYLLPEQTITQF